MSEVVLTSARAEETLAIGRRLGWALACGHVVALVGPLGSGKTTLVKGVAEGAGVVDLRQVNSPTFVIINEYETTRERGALRIFHVDAYRLRGGSDLEALGFEELCVEGAVLVEWADRVGAVLPADLLTIRIAPVADEERTLTCTAAGAQAAALLEALAAGH